MGNVGIGTVTPSTQLHCTGQITMDGASGTDHVLDVAEVIPVADDVEEGDVISIDGSSQKYRFTKSKEPNDRLVAGVISSTQKGNKSIPAMFIGNAKQREADNPGQKYKYLTIAGQVAVKVCLEGGPIRKGDLLTTSSTAGYAMRAQKMKHGSIIGKALEDFEGKEGDKGMIIALFVLLYGTATIFLLLFDWF